MPKFCHDLDDFENLCRAIAGEKGIPEQLVEKDYWIMHCLWGLKQLSFDFHMKGGTSLSKGWRLLERFSEDIDIHILPFEGQNIPTGKNHQKPTHVEKRKEYFESLAEKIKIPGIVSVIRDTTYDDLFMRNAGIRLMYKSLFDDLQGVKTGILLEVGFDQTSPNEEKNITSWAYDKAISVGEEINNNRAKKVACYCPEYTFVEKLQTLSTKFRQEQETGKLKENQLRHYYDVDCLLKEERIRNFIETEDYIKHKEKRFRSKDNFDLTQNEAFLLSDLKTLKKYEKGFQNIESLFYGKQKPRMKQILANLKPWLSKL